MASQQPKDVRAGFTTVTAGTLVLFVATLLLVGFTFVARVLIVRSVSVASWNAFSLGYALVQVLLAVGTYGITVAVARTLSASQTEAESRTVVRTALALGVGAAVATGGGLILAAPYIGRALGSSQLTAGLGFFGIAIACLIVASVLASIFQGFSNVLPNALFIQIVNPGVFLAILATAYVVPLGHGLTAAVVPAATTAAVQRTARRSPCRWSDGSSTISATRTPSPASRSPPRSRSRRRPSTPSAPSPVRTCGAKGTRRAGRSFFG